MFTNRSPEESRPVLNRTTIALLLIFVTGLGLRLLRLDYQGVWYDEAFSLTVSNLSLGQMTSRLVADFVHPPLHYYLLHSVFQAFGFGEFQARIVSVVFGALTIPVMFLLGRYLFGKATGLVGALLVSVSQLAVMYSQEARPYVVSVFFSVCAVYCFVVAFREGRRLAWSGFICFIVLMLYTNYYTVLVLVCLGIYSVVDRAPRRIPVVWWTTAGAVLILTMLPWLTTGVIGNALHSSRVMPANQAPWFSTHWLTFFRDVNRFNNGAYNGLLDSAPRWSFALGGLLFLWPVWLAVRPLTSHAKRGPEDGPHKPGSGLLLLLWLLPHTTLLILAGLGVQYAPRYALFCMLPYYLLVAQGAASMRSRFCHFTWLAAIVLYSGFALRANYFMPYKEDYRSALGHMASAQQTSDCELFLPSGYVPLQWNIYHAGQPRPEIIQPDDRPAVVERCGRIWIVKYLRVLAPPSKLQRVEQSFTQAFDKVEEQHFFWVDTVLYARRPQ